MILAAPTNPLITALEQLSPRDRPCSIYESHQRDYPGDHRAGARRNESKSRHTEDSTVRRFLPFCAGRSNLVATRVLNLVMNGIAAMSGVTDRSRELLICSHQHESDQMLVAVRESGIGVDRQNLENVFNAFYTTKSQGMGMGWRSVAPLLRITVGGYGLYRITFPGARFQFTVLKHQ
jgi:C4-dicarboxylate-specific signal transduction histidine kinase